MVLVITLHLPDPKYAYPGPDGPLLEAIPKPPTGIDGAQTGRLRTKLADALYLTTKAGALPKGDAAQAMSWRDFMALVNKSGAKLGEADPVWWDLQQYMRPQGSVMVVDAAAVAELLSECCSTCSVGVAASPF